MTLGNQIGMTFCVTCYLSHDNHIL